MTNCHMPACLAHTRLRPRAHPRCAFTAIELLVVISIIAIMLGIGGGVYFGFIRATALQAETRAVMAVIQSAQGTALAEGCETSVCVDTDKGQLYPFGRTKVGVWHFEALETNPARAYGAFGHAALVTGTATLAEGRIGKAISLDGNSFLKCKMFRPPAAWVEIPTYDTREGVALDAWVFPTDGMPGQKIIISRNGWFELSLERQDTEPSTRGNYWLHGEAVTLNADATAYVRCQAASPAVIRPNEWTHVSMSCHRLGGVVILRINGVEQTHETSSSEAAPAPDPAAETVIGADPGGNCRFNGCVDELMISTYAVDVVHTVTRKLTVEKQGLADGNTIRFDSFGRLAAIHGGVLPRIILRDPAGGAKTLVTITVGTMGALDVKTE